MFSIHPGARVVTMDCLYLGGGIMAQDAWIMIGENGLIDEIGQGNPPQKPEIHYKGLVFGGLVNAHCHLELSHLKGLIPEYTGMAGFVTRLQAVRGGFTENEAIQASVDAVKRMAANGIRGVADICNGTHSLKAKELHPEMHFHSFVEVFGLDPSRAEEAFLRALDIAGNFGERASVTLHAPYSISTALRDQVQAYAAVREWPQSLHLLESKEERQLFASLDGPLMDMIRGLKAPFPGHVSPSPLEYLVPGQPKEVNTLLVHLTEITAEEAQWLKDYFGERAFAVLCPRANMYIHDSLPPLGAIRDSGLKICLGTDSLAGNWTLDIWAEMQVLQQKFGASTSEMLVWAVDNGCEALGFPREDFIPTAGHPFRAFQLENFDVSSGLIPETTTINSISA